MPGALAQPHVTIDGANHVFQEDASPQLVDVILDALGRSTPALRRRRRTSGHRE